MTSPTRTRPIALAAVCDVVAILVFVIIGRFNHDDGLTIPGIFSTFWPFAIGGAVGWSIAYVIAHVRSGEIGDHDFRPENLVPDGILTWIGAVAIGMILRDQFGQGVAVSFVIVATIVLGVFLLGWRAARARLARRAARP